VAIGYLAVHREWGGRGETQRRNPNTNEGGQFFITEARVQSWPAITSTGATRSSGAAPRTELVRRITALPRNSSDRPETPVFIRHVRVRRG
jgi:hypothetical protein